jgi:hypothetical protein
MKKKFFVTAILTSILIQFATAQTGLQNNNSLAQVLQRYYDIKEALVTGKADGAAAAARAFIKNVNGITYTVISEGNIHALLKDAGLIAETDAIHKQRQVFANLSENIMMIARSLKLTGDPVFLQYCPMKKASWLSNEKAIRNPYYGDSMLTCGKVTDTL